MKIKKAHIYLNFIDNCEAAFHFYRSVFNSEFIWVSKFKDMPPSEDYPLAEKDREKLIHISMPIMDNMILMGSDLPESMERQFVAGNNFSISLNSNDKPELERLFTALSEGGNVIMPANKTFWSEYYGLVIDKFGIAWQVNMEQEQ